MAFDLSRLNLRRWAVLTFAGACLVVNAVAFVIYQKNRELVDAREWVRHTYNVINTTNDILFSIQDMNVATRGYLLTGDAKFLAPYHAAEKRVEPALAELIDLTRDNPERQKQLPELKATYEKQHALMERQIERRARNQAVESADMQISLDLMNVIRNYNATILTGEQDLLVTRAKRESDQQQNYMRTIFATAGLSIFGLLIANGVIAFLTIRRQAAEDHLRRINKEMEGFTYIASHDLRSPLVNLKGFASEMKWGLNELRPILDKVLPHATPDEQAKAVNLLDQEIPDALHYIHSSVEKMDKLTNAILELSRIGRRPLKLEQIDPNPLVKRILDTLQHQIVTKNVQVKIHPMPFVTADLLSLEQVFGNIIDNAIKYLDTSRPGKLEIGGHRSHRMTTFWVKDNGRGIAKTDMEKIFEIYRRGSNNRDIPGEGMGMAYVRTTLRRMGGMIRCESVQDVGSIFYFTISNTLEKELNHD